MTLIDTHSHIDMPEFEDLDKVIANAQSFGVEKIIIPSVDVNSFAKVIEIADKYEGIYCALGIHPSEAQNAKEEDFVKLAEHCSNKNVVAIGECGLDYYWDKTFITEQKAVFLKQIILAKTLKKTLIVHDREAHKDCFDMLTQNLSGEIPIVMHCFSGSLEFAQECIKKGFYIALGGVVTFKNAKKVHEIAKHIPLDKLLLETDAPYLAPEPYRGKTNEPAYVKYVAEKIAEIRGISFDEIARITTDNAKEVFGI
ncbi:MAG: TatD family hydrolase [Candidatus Gastranaerophilales bacterium]|nr:TatD family hydrolase [Candidatus Gastranaerophilales bacterium]